ncbi:MAG: D-2-hydroxyacid dehydrogenase [Alsobacter sp.]
MTRSPAVLVHSDRPDAVLAVIGEAHPDLRLEACTDYAGLPAALARSGAEVVYTVRFAGTPGFPRAALVESPTVRWASVGGSGTDHLQPWDATRVTVTNAAGVAAGMMAEYALGTILSFTLGLRQFAQRQRERAWSAARVEPVEGKTLLVLGLGHTGEALASRAKALGMTVLGVRARPRPTPHVDEVHGIEALPGHWGRADAIVCCVPLLPTTRGLVGQAAFSAMKPGVVLVDVSRGGVVEEKALLAALDSGRIKGAALDVFATEPLPRDHALWAHEAVIVTPHCSSVYDGWEEKSARMFAENLARYREGLPLRNVVDPVRGY